MESFVLLVTLLTKPYRTATVGNHTKCVHS